MINDHNICTTWPTHTAHDFTLKKKTIFTATIEGVRKTISSTLSSSAHNVEASRDPSPCEFTHFDDFHSDDFP